MNDIIRTLQFEKEQLEARIRLLENKLESDNRQISEYDAELREAKAMTEAEKKEAILDGQKLIQSFAKTVMAILDSNGVDEATLEFDFKGRHFTAELYCELIGEEGGNNA
jgi:molecular chaperone GrpE (heat shock protein)